MTSLKPPDTLLLLRIAAQLDDIRQRVERLEMKSSSNSAAIWGLQADMETISVYLNGYDEEELLQ